MQVSNNPFKYLLEQWLHVPNHCWNNLYILHIEPGVNKNDSYLLHFVCCFKHLAYWFKQTNVREHVWKPYKHTCYICHFVLFDQIVLFSGRYNLTIWSDPVRCSLLSSLQGNNQDGVICFCPASSEEYDSYLLYVTCRRSRNSELSERVLKPIVHCKKVYL